MAGSPADLCLGGSLRSLSHPERRRRKRRRSHPQISRPPGQPDSPAFSRLRRHRHTTAHRAWGPLGVWPNKQLRDAEARVFLWCAGISCTGKTLEASCNGPVDRVSWGQKKKNDVVVHTLPEPFEREPGTSLQFYADQPLSRPPLLRHNRRGVGQLV